MAKTSYTALQAEVRREVRRIQQFVRRAEQRGFEFPQQIKDIKFNKKNASTRRLEQLRRWTAEKLYGKAKYASEKTYGEIVSGKKGREIERREAARKSAQTRRERERQYTYDEDDYYPTVDIVEDVRDRLENLPDILYVKGKKVSVESEKNILLSIFQQQLASRGYSGYSNYLSMIEDSLYTIIDEVEYSAYDIDAVKASYAEIGTLLKGSALEFSEMQDIENYYDNMGF